MSDPSIRAYKFGKFRFEPAAGSLWADGELVALSPKAADLLAMLVEREGGVVTREEILERVWPGTYVEEGNINYTISLLRKSLGAKDIIETVPRRGYRITTAVEAVTNEPPPTEPPAPVAISPRNAAGIGSKTKLGLIAAVLISMFIAVGWFAFPRSGTGSRTSAEPTIDSIAVLPLKALSDNEENNAAAMGLTDSLISRLGSLGRFKVRPFSAVERFIKGNKDAVDFGKSIKCDAVLTGTYRDQDGRLRVTLQMIDVRDGVQMWTSAFEAEGGDIFALQDQIALQVAGLLVEKLTPADELTLGKRYTDNREAYLSYMRGRITFNRRSENGHQASLDAFQHALALDPAFALAYAGLADLFSRRGNGASGAEAEEAFKLSRQYVRRALELDGDLSEAHASLGRLKRVNEWDWSGAESEFKRAIELDPNNAMAIAWYAQMLSILGRHNEALAMIDRAIEIDPITPSIGDVKFPILEAAGDLDSGLKLAEERHSFDKENMSARRALATFLYSSGQYERSVALAEETNRMPRSKDHVWIALLAAGYSKLGQHEMAGEYLRRLEDDAHENSKSQYSLAVIYAEMGRTDDAFAALEKCLEAHEERLVWMNVEPRFAPIRDDARFQQIVEKLQLTSS